MPTRLILPLRKAYGKPATERESLEGTPRKRSKRGRALKRYKLAKAWSTEAREAALEARRAAMTDAGPNAGKMTSAKVEIDEPDSTTIAEPIEVVGRTTPPPEYKGSLTKDERPIDYGHCGELMREKYGPNRGQASYDALIDNPNSGIYFVIGEKIIREKMGMMQALDKKGPVENHNYQGLYKLWKEKGGGPKIVSVTDSKEKLRNRAGIPEKHR